jgi:thiamine kinase-like enzyme
MTQPSANPGTPLPPHVRAAVDAVVARVPAWRQARRGIRVAPLEGALSLNNVNYRLTVDGADYVLRIAADTVARHLGVRRHEEGAAASAAARAGIAPELVYFDAGTGHMVSRLIPGRHWEPEDFRAPGNIGRLAATLRRLHAIRGVPAQGWVYRRVERLLQSARSLGLQMPPDLSVHEERMRRLEARRQADPRVRVGLCHHDLWANNFLDDGQDLWLVDWEFGGEGDGLYDLATLSLAGGYSAAQHRELLRAYFGECGSDDLQSLQVMQYAVFFFEAAWALVQHGLRGSSPPGFDYLGYARRRFQAMEERLETGGI